MEPSFLIFDSADAAAGACADPYSALSGGSTPRLIFEPWRNDPSTGAEIQIFQVDERCVSPDNALSNFRMMRESFPDAARIEEKQVHRIRGESIPDDAVGLYVAVFDVIARGMGPDAHTAGEPLIGDSQRNRGRGVYGETEIGAASDHPAPRGILEGARHTLCLAAGGEKAEAIRRVLRGPFDPVETRA